MRIQLPEVWVYRVMGVGECTKLERFKRQGFGVV